MVGGRKGVGVLLGGACCLLKRAGALETLRSNRTRREARVEWSHDATNGELESKIRGRERRERVTRMGKTLEI